MTSSYQPSFKAIQQGNADGHTVYWITHAGGATLTLANRIKALGDPVADNVLALQLPHREEFSGIGFDGDMNALAGLAASQIANEQIANEQSANGGRFSLVGHSFGSVLAYRIASELVALGSPPSRLTVLSFPAPDRLSHEETLHRLSDAELVQKVDELFGGIPDGIRQDVDAMAFFVPGLRSDLALLEGYQHEAQSQVLPVPISAICGTDDRAVNLAQMQRWQQMTSSPFRLLAMPGDHFFPLSRMREILQIAVS